MTRKQMLSALQADVHAWPQQVRDAGVTNAAGAAYVPVARNNEILRTPADAEATYAYMVRTWQATDSDPGSAGWNRIIEQGGHELTWEYLMIDDSRSYSELFPAGIRERVRNALDAHPGSSVWFQRKAEIDAAQREKRERIDRIREEMRSGKRKRLSLPELDGGL